jgi:hypothetical protein
VCRYAAVSAIQVGVANCMRIGDGRAAPFEKETLAAADLQWTRHGGGLYELNAADPKLGSAWFQPLNL